MWAQFQLLGRLGADPKLRYAKDHGRPYVILRLAVSRSRWVNAETRDVITDWIPVGVFGKSAEYVATYGHKGAVVAVRGRMIMRNPTKAQDGEYPSIMLQSAHVQVVGRKVPAPPAVTPPPTLADVELPF